MIKIYLASDHAGFEHKEELKKYLKEFENFDVEDCGNLEYVDGDDYTDFIHIAGQKLAKDIKNNIASVAFVFGGSGEGEAMIMNRYMGVRCTTYYGGNLDIILLGREHNNANAISFGARFLDFSEVEKSVQLFFETDFAGGRHEKRIKAIDLK